MPGTDASKTPRATSQAPELVIERRKVAVVVVFSNLAAHS